MEAEKEWSMRKGDAENGATRIGTVEIVGQWHGKKERKGKR